jgi:hypothetical protein
MKDRKLAGGLTAARHRHEWQSFLALQPVLDLSGLDPILYQRCLGVVWRLRGQAVISRDDLLRLGGLAFQGSIDWMLARLIREEALVPILPEPFRFRVRSCGWTNPESVYAGDDRRALIEITRKEQEERLRAIREIETSLDLARLPEKRRARIRQERDELRKIYEATWLELSDATGSTVRERIQHEIEGASTTCATQLDLCFEDVRRCSQEGEENAESKRSGTAESSSGDAWRCM